MKPTKNQQTTNYEKWNEIGDIASMKMHKSLRLENPGPEVQRENMKNPFLGELISIEIGILLNQYHSSCVF